jgi:hypothetical protein
VLVVLQRQVHRPVVPVGLVHGRDHLQGRPAVGDASEGRAVLLDLLDQVIDDPPVAVAGLGRGGSGRPR